MSGVLTAVAAVLMIAVPFDWYAAWQLARAAWQRPRIPALSFAALIAIAIAASTTIGGLLGLHSIFYQLTGERILPPALTLVMLATALIVISLPNLYLLRLLRRWDSEVRSFHIHHRSSERQVIPHRRVDDPPVDEIPTIDPLDHGRNDR